MTWLRPDPNPNHPDPDMTILTLTLTWFWHGTVPSRPALRPDPHPVHTRADITLYSGIHCNVRIVYIAFTAASPQPSAAPAEPAPPQASELVEAQQALTLPLLLILHCDHRSFGHVSLACSATLHPVILIGPSPPWQDSSSVGNATDVGSAQTRDASEERSVLFWDAPASMLHPNPNSNPNPTPLLAYSILA